MLRRSLRPSGHARFCARTDPSDDDAIADGSGRYGYTETAINTDAQDCDRDRLGRNQNGSTGGGPGPQTNSVSDANTYGNPRLFGGVGCSDVGPGLVRTDRVLGHGSGGPLH